MLQVFIYWKPLLTIMLLMEMAVPPMWGGGQLFQRCIHFEFY
jgi:hypothetical protein